MNYFYNLVDRITFIIINLGDNAVFLALLTLWPAIPIKYLVILHIAVLVARQIYSTNSLFDSQNGGVQLPPLPTESVITNPTKITTVVEKPS